MRAYLDAEDVPAMTFGPFCGALLHCAMLLDPSTHTNANPNAPPVDSFQALVQRLLRLFESTRGRSSSSSAALVQHSLDARRPWWSVRPNENTNSDGDVAVDRSFLETAGFREVVATLTRDVRVDAERAALVAQRYAVPEELAAQFRPEALALVTERFQTFDVLDRGVLPRQELFALLSGLAKRLDIVDIYELLAVLLSGQAEQGSSGATGTASGVDALVVTDVTLPQLLRAIHHCRRSRSAVVKPTRARHPQQQQQQQQSQRPQQSQQSPDFQNGRQPKARTDKHHHKLSPPKGSRKPSKKPAELEKEDDATRRASKTKARAVAAAIGKGKSPSKHSLDSDAIKSKSKHSLVGATAAAIAAATSTTNNNNDNNSSSMSSSVVSGLEKAPKEMEDDESLPLMRRLSRKHSSSLDLFSSTRSEAPALLPRPTALGSVVQPPETSTSPEDYRRLGPTSPPLLATDGKSERLRPIEDVVDGPSDLELRMYLTPSCTSRSSPLDGAVCLTFALRLRRPRRLRETMGVHFAGNGDRVEVWSTVDVPVGHLRVDATVQLVQRRIDMREREGFPARARRAPARAAAPCRAGATPAQSATLRVRGPRADRAVGRDAVGCRVGRDGRRLAAPAAAAVARARQHVRARAVVVRPAGDAQRLAAGEAPAAQEAATAAEGHGE
ncbi:hypothetical protein PINS_up011719 [Pythium insidiosum]|nr:hypothetical protein PINS_up011719 [Pythium insidiosum]